MVLKKLQNEVQFEGLSFQDIKVNPFETSLFNLTQEIGLKGLANTVQVPKDYVLLNRMVTLLLGICNTLDPHMNPIEVIRPYFQQFVLGERGDIVNFIRELLQKTLANVISLPSDLRKTLDQTIKVFETNALNLDRHIIALVQAMQNMVQDLRKKTNQREAH